MKLRNLAVLIGGQYVNYWIHSGMIMVDKEKNVEIPRQFLHYS